MTYGEIEALKQDLAGLAAHLAHLQAHFGKVCEQQAAHLRDHFDRELQDIRGHLRQVEERLEEVRR